MDLLVGLSGVGPVPFKYDAESKTIEARPGQALAPGDYSVTVTGKAAGKRVETQWRFKVEAAGKAGAVKKGGQ